MLISLCARSKILQLLEPGSTFRIRSTGNFQAGSHVDLIPNTEVLPSDCTISLVPHIVADIQTVTAMADHKIDFDYNTEEFIISNRG